MTASGCCLNYPKIGAVKLDTDDDNVSEVVSMTSLISRSNSRSSTNSRGRAVSSSMPGSRSNSRSLSKNITSLLIGLNHTKSMNFYKELCKTEKKEKVKEIA